MVSAGIGCRRGATADDVLAAVHAALAEAGIAQADVLATSLQKAREPGLSDAASELGIPLVAVDDDALLRAADRVVTRSERVLALTGVPSVAEASALAAAGPGSRLILARIIVGPATCALAAGAEDPIP